MAKLNADLLDDLTIKAAKYGDKPNPLRDGRGCFFFFMKMAVNIFS